MHVMLTSCGSSPDSFGVTSLPANGVEGGAWGRDRWQAAKCCGKWDKDIEVLQAGHPRKYWKPLLCADCKRSIAPVQDKLNIRHFVPAQAERKAWLAQGMRYERQQPRAGTSPTQQVKKHFHVAIQWLLVYPWLKAWLCLHIQLILVD